MRSRADILVLDEPTAAMDAAAEATIFEHFRGLTKDRIAILIPHRFSTVRMADQIIVIQDGRIIEHGSHDQLIAAEGLSAPLFSLQAQRYRCFRRSEEPRIGKECVRLCKSPWP